MSTLGDQLDDYLRLRRALGFQLGRHGESLPDFVAYLEANRATTITVELAVAWARLPHGIKPITVDYRLSAVRGFARYLHALDPAHQIPPAGLLSVPRRRPTPYIYTPGEIDDVLAPRAGCGHRCGPQPKRRCSGCWRPQACAVARRWR